MQHVSAEQLRSNLDGALSRVEAGYPLTITRDGVPVAVISPAHTPALDADAVIEAWKNVPTIDAQQLRADVEALVGFDSVLSR